MRYSEDSRCLDAPCMALSVPWIKSRKKIVSLHSPVTNVLHVTESLLAQKLSVLLEDGLNATRLGRQRYRFKCSPWQILSELSSLVSGGDRNAGGPTSNLCRFEQKKSERLLEGALWGRDKTGTLPNVLEDLKSEMWKYLKILTTILVNLRK